MLRIRSQADEFWMHLIKGTGVLYVREPVWISELHPGVRQANCKTNVRQSNDICNLISNLLCYTVILVLAAQPLWYESLVKVGNEESFARLSSGGILAELR